MLAWPRVLAWPSPKPCRGRSYQRRRFRIWCAGPPRFLPGNENAKKWHDNMSQWKGESRDAWLVRQRAEHRAWRERNRERLRVYQRGYGRKYRAAHYDRLREYYRKWLAANRKRARGRCIGTDRRTDITNCNN